MLLVRCRRRVSERSSALDLETLDIFEPKHWPWHRADHCNNGLLVVGHDVPCLRLVPRRQRQGELRQSTTRDASPQQRGRGWKRFPFTRSHVHTPARGEETKHDTKWNMVMKRQKIMTTKIRKFDGEFFLRKTIFGDKIIIPQFVSNSLDFDGCDPYLGFVGGSSTLEST